MFTIASSPAWPECPRDRHLLRQRQPEDALGRLHPRVAESCDKRGHCTTNQYNDLGQLDRTDYPTVNGVAAFETFTYDLEGRRKTHTDREGRTTTSVYEDGRQVKTIAPDQSFTETKYLVGGRVDWTKDARGNKTRYRYDRLGRREAVVNALDQETVFTYDRNGQTETVTDARGHVVTSKYDDVGRLVQTLFEPAAGHGVTWTTTKYDAAGRRNRTVDQAGQATEFRYDDAGRLTKVIQDPEGFAYETTFTYDELGNRLTQTDARGHTTSFLYDELGRMVEKTYPAVPGRDPSVEIYGHDPNGNRNLKIDPNGLQTTYVYDKLNRLEEEIPGSGDEYMTYSYDAGGKLEAKETRALADGSVLRRIAYVYETGTNTMGRLIAQETWDADSGVTDVVNYRYDAVGNRTKVWLGADENDPVLGAVVTAYDALNRPKTLTLPGGDGVIGVGYDQNGNRKTLTYPNGVVTTYGYDALNRLETITQARPGGVLERYTYELGAAGNREAVTEVDGRYTDWIYDELYRLEGEVVSEPGGAQRAWGFTYDAVGNRTSMSDTTLPSDVLYDYDERDQLTSATTTAGTVDYIWDDAGRMVGKTVDQVTQDYGWNAWDRMIDGPTEKGDPQLRYGPDGIVASKSAVGGLDRRYVYDRSETYAQLLAEIDESTGAVLARYVYLDGDLVSMEDTRVGNANEGRYWVLKDGQNSVRMVLDGSAQVVASYDYSAFGEILDATSFEPGDWIFPHRAFGEVLDPNLGWGYHRARWLDNETGRFVSRDPWGGRREDPPSLHRFQYAAQDPVQNRDPSGLWLLGHHNTLSNAALDHAEITHLQARVLVTEGSRVTDLAWQFQNYMHSMRDNSETVEEATARSDAHLENRLQAAIDSARSGFIAEALYTLGQGLHTTQDEVHHFCSYGEHFTGVTGACREAVDGRQDPPPLPPGQSYPPGFICRTANEEYSDALIRSKNYIDAFMAGLSESQQDAVRGYGGVSGTVGTIATVVGHNAVENSLAPITAIFGLVNTIVPR